MKILVTGSGGFIGKALLSALKRRSEFVVEGMDVLEGRSTSLLRNDYAYFDVIFHFAATNGTRLFYSNPTEVLINNMQSSLDVAEYLKKNPKTSIVFASTCEIFNGAIDKGFYSVPTDEKVPVMFDDVSNPRWSYSLPKAVGENLFSNLHNSHLNIRFFNIFGPNQVDHFIPEFIARADSGDFKLLGNDTRAFCFIDDAVGMLIKLLEANIWNETVNVGNNSEIKVSSLANKILHLMDIKDTSLEILSSPKGSVSRRSPLMDKYNRLIGPFPYTDLDTALKITIDSYRK